LKPLLIESRIGDCRIFVDEPLEEIRGRLASASSVVITDTNVRRLYGSLLPKGRVIDIGAGESVKNLKTVEFVFRRFLEMEVDRSTFVWGLGGGVVCDIAGFAASTFMRGLRFGFVPTTLLAQVDAAIGGKNGVNLDGYKNLVGVFRPPQCVVLNFDVLRTLSGADILGGLTETVKVGLIAKASFFRFVEKNWPALRALERRALRRAVLESIRIKAGIVGADPEESGERKKLNFGHTLGHALEKAVGLPHGQAVAIGMTFAVRLSAARGLLPEKEARRVETILERLRPPAAPAPDLDLVLKAVLKDKKRRGPDIDVVLLERIGKAGIVKIPIQEMENVLHDLCQHC
jgi:3-dehydroquinate synthase